MHSRKRKSNTAQTLKKYLTVVLSIALIITVSAGCATTTTTDSGETTSSGSSSIVMIVYLLIVVVIFYFLMIRPEKKRKKQANDMRNSLAIGDNIVTIGGIIGKIVNISDEYVTFETGEDRVRIKIAKWGISSTGKDVTEPDEKAGE